MAIRQIRLKNDEILGKKCKEVKKFDEKLWTCFLHALYCLKQNEFMTKSSLKKRFGLKSNQNYSISKLIKSAIDKNLLAIVDPTVTSRYLKFRLGSKYNLK